MARAIYSKAETLILDDILSGQDAITHESLVDRLFSPQGTLRMSKTTVIFATHTGEQTFQLLRLKFDAETEDSSASILSLVDHIVILEKDGIILEQGSYEYLKARGSLEHLSLQQHLSKHDDYDEMGLSESFGGFKTEAFRSKRINHESTINSKQPTSNDLAVYNYYFKSAGRASVVISWITQALSAFFFVFPCKHF